MSEMANKRAVFHLDIKAVDDEARLIEGYASVAGIEDRDEEVMTVEALKSGIDEYMRNPVILYQHGRDPDVGMNPIGRVLEYMFQDSKLWVRAQIARGDAFADKIWNLIKQGVLRAFSVGAVPSLVERVGRTITKWPVVEISVVTIPANAYATFSVVKMLDTGTDIELTSDDEHNSTTTDDMETTTNSADTETTALDTSNQILKTEKMMDKEQFEDMYGEFKARMDAEQAEKDAEETRVNEIAEKRAKEMFEKAQAELKMQRDPDKMIHGGDEPEKKASPIRVLSKWDNMNIGDHATAYMFMKQRALDYPGRFSMPGDEVYRSLAVKAAKHLDGDFDTKAFAAEELEGPALKGLMNLAGKSDELVHSTQSGYGDEWVPTLAAEDLWRTIRLTARVLPLFQQFDMPSQPFDYPAESTDPIFYTQAETTGEASLSWTSAGPFKKSKVATAKVTFSAGKLGAMTVWSTEMGEDSIIAIEPSFRDQYGVVLAETIDEVLISGDETTGDTTNISYEGATITSKSRFLVVDGLRHEGLVTTTADSRDGGVLSIEDFTATRALMGTAGKYGVVPSDLAFIADAGVYYKAVDLPEKMTLDQVGPSATILTGQVLSIQGIPFIVPERYSLTDATGRIDETAADNILGSFLCVRRSGIKVGWRRRPQVSVERLPGFDAYAIMATLRLDIRYFGAGMVALTYNVTI